MKLKGIELQGEYKVVFEDDCFIVYDKKGNEIYGEDSDGYWVKREYDKQGNEIYYEDSVRGILLDKRQNERRISKMMKVFRIDTDYGLQETLTEKELQEQYTPEEIQEFKDNEQTYFYITKYTVNQLNKARKLHSNEAWCYNFEDEFDYTPNVNDILEHLYN